MPVRGVGMCRESGGVGRKGERDGGERNAVRREPE